jgi:2-haloacid dehalogenase
VLEVAVAGDRWLTFDCYGTIADWNTCMGAALSAAAGPAQGPALLAAYHQAELMLEGGPAWQPYKDVLVTADTALLAAWPSMPVFEDARPALTALAAAGWKLAILTNCDDDLFATTVPRLPVPFDLVVTAEQVGGYKPDLGHFRRFASATGATPESWIHVACSWVHDILPAARMGLRSVWVDRDLTGHPAKQAERRVTSMRRLPETVADVMAAPVW